MGADKANLSVGGRTMLEHSRHLLRCAGAGSVIVLGRDSEPDGIADRLPGTGPVSAITDYLAASEPGGKHLFLPVDMPGLTVKLLVSLVKKDGWASYKRYHLPLLAVANGRTPSPIRRIQDLLTAHDAARVTPPPGSDRAFVNLNRPEELARWRTLQSA